MRRANPTINSGSMADIAFLLLIFFLVTTTIIQDKGLTVKLPPVPKELTVQEIHERNIFKVIINSNDKIMVQGDVRKSTEGLRDEVKEFILNHNLNPKLSENPEKAIVSLKTNRGTSYKSFISVLDELQAAYYEIYGGRVNMSANEFRKLDLADLSQKKVYLKARAGIPMNISIAEPDN
ncbi:MAG: ExbD/TolR family protein [Candidatus Cyclobacteriaceae bacterium M2_1C_046]